MKPTKQAVYLPVKADDELPAESCKCGIIKNGEFDLSYFIKAPSYKVFDHVKSGLSHNQAEITHWLKPQEAIVFTPEQLNDYITTIIKQTLQTAAEKVETKIVESYAGSLGNENGELYNKVQVNDEKSITDTFEETYQKFKV